MAKTVLIERLTLEVQCDLNFGQLLFVWLSNLGEERMFESLVYADSEVWVELKHLLEQVHSLVAGPWVLLLEVQPGDVVETFKIPDGLLVSHI